MPAQRLQKILAQAGIASRRHSEALIVAGRVAVNGVVVTQLGAQADPAVDRVEVDGRPVLIASERAYYLLNKPRGYLSTCYDPQGRKTVLELVPYAPGLHPVGRLDRDTSGLLIVTNDGGFTEALTHPRHGIAKTYVAEVRGRPSASALTTLRDGVRLEGGTTLPARVEALDRRADTTTLAVTIREGRNRQVRRMMEAVGHPVVRLERVAIGEMTAGNLPEGQFRPLLEAEVQALLRSARRTQGRGGARG
ncbi:MAG: pseudouridine synthase [Candidatus Sericytochromatia bacterium]|nr:pseudouridine synthase [Candidatus Sericytochromatia bacterium]MEB3221410.1 pseudouridine synthase [Candidatus Sericytochromatia bacterium]